ncbi:hypothetical protein HPB50_028670 [Hyalomma asiaticum]|nr:hypothetical protein HPB50_028670 [Hyalomma asiaticum]
MVSEDRCYQWTSASGYILAEDATSKKVLVACSSASEGRLNVKAFREWHRQASITTEALWNDVRRNLPKKKKTEVPEGRLLILEGAKVDRRHQEVLKCGPKYCVEPRLSIVDKLALTRDIARSVPENEKERCVVECVYVIAKVEAKGVCIGSKVAPILSTIFLASIDRELDEELEGITYNIYSDCPPLTHALIREHFAPPITLAKHFATIVALHQLVDFHDQFVNVSDLLQHVFPSR